MNRVFMICKRPLVFAGLVSLLTLSISPLLTAQTDPSVELDQLVKSLSGSLNEMQRSSEPIHQIAEKIKEFQTEIKEGDFVAANRALSGLGLVRVSAESVKAKDEAVERATAVYDSALAEQVQLYNTKIEKLAQEATAAVKTAKISADLDEVQDKGSSLSDELYSRQFVSREIDDKDKDKLTAIRFFLENFSTYLSRRSAGDSHGANSSLRKAVVTPLAARIFSAEDVQQLEVSETLNLESVFGDKVSIKDFDSVSKKYEAFKSSSPPGYAKEFTRVDREMKRFQEISQLINSEDWDGAVGALTYRVDANFVEDYPLFEELKERATLQVFQAQTKGLTELQPEKDESTLAFASRLLEQESETGDYEAMARVLELVTDMSYGQSLPNWLRADARGVADYVVGIRSLDSGDRILAVKYLREVIEETGGKYTPIDLAKKKLNEIFESGELGNEPALLEVEELKSETKRLRDRLQTLERERMNLSAKLRELEQRQVR